MDSWQSTLHSDCLEKGKCWVLDLPCECDYGAECYCMTMEPCTPRLLLQRQVANREEESHSAE